MHGMNIGSKQKDQMANCFITAVQKTKITTHTMNPGSKEQAQMATCFMTDVQDNMITMHGMIHGSKQQDWMATYFMTGVQDSKVTIQTMKLWAEQQDLFGAGLLLFKKLAKKWIWPGEVISTCAFYYDKPRFDFYQRPIPSSILLIFCWGLNSAAQKAAFIGK